MDRPGAELCCSHSPWGNVLVAGSMVGGERGQPLGQLATPSLAAQIHNKFTTRRRPAPESGGLEQCTLPVTVRSTSKQNDKKYNGQAYSQTLPGRRQTVLLVVSRLIVERSSGRA